MAMLSEPAGRFTMAHNGFQNYFQHPTISINQTANLQSIMKLLNSIQLVVNESLKLMSACSLAHKHK